MAKVGFALSTVIFGVVLQMFGYSADAPLGIRLVGPVAGAGVLLGLMLFGRGYRVRERFDLGGAALSDGNPVGSR